jgi:hypothetical protein
MTVGVTCIIIAIADLKAAVRRTLAAKDVGGDEVWMFWLYLGTIVVFLG